MEEVIDGEVDDLTHYRLGRIFDFEVRVLTVRRTGLGLCGIEGLVFLGQDRLESGESQSRLLVVLIHGDLQVTSEDHLGPGGYVDTLFVVEGFAEFVLLILRRALGTRQLGDSIFQLEYAWI